MSFANTAALLPLACLLSAAATGCAPALEPDYVTPAGLQVFTEEEAQSFDGAELDAIVTETLTAFSDVWGLPADPSQLPLPVLSVLGADSYSLGGRKVAGNVSVDGRWVYIAARTRPLHDTAL